jgi:hypothetical protein
MDYSGVGRRNDGGGSAGQSLVNKRVSMSATYRRDGSYPFVLDGIAGLPAKEFAGKPVEKAFMEHTPDATAYDAYLKR